MKDKRILLGALAGILVLAIVFAITRRDPDTVTVVPVAKGINANPEPSTEPAEFHQALRRAKTAESDH